MLKTYQMELPRWPVPREFIPSQLRGNILMCYAFFLDTIKQVNDQIKNGKEGRLFAVVHICGKQFKITSEDVIIIEGYWPPQIGDEIKLEKVCVYLLIITVVLFNTILVK